MAELQETTWERRIGAVMQTLVAATLLWIGNSVVDMRTELVVLKSQVSTLTGQVPQVATLLQNVRDLEYSNRELERRINALENKRGIQNNQDR